ncbi:hypothetical protein ACHAWF_011165 [Thalassiosira exigua]
MTTPRPLPPLRPAVPRRRRRGRRLSSLAWALLVLLAVAARGAVADDNDGDEEFENEPTGPVVGIDLGTTYSCVGILRSGGSGKVEIVPNDQGNRVTPSYVAFLPAEEGGDEATGEGGGTAARRLIGDAARNQATLNPSRTVFDAKRLIGRKWSDPTVREDRKLMPYEIVPGGLGGGDDHWGDEREQRPFIAIDRRRYAPEEISGMLLSKLRADAERYLGETVERAVVTVPAYFNDAQRHATRDAGVIAGLRVERIINEPTAAAIAFGVQRGSGTGEEHEEETILVFDLGGGTFDVTLLTIDNGIFEVLSTNGDTHLGGSDVDKTIVDHFLKVMKRRDNVDVRNNVRALQKLRREAERVKRALSTQLSARTEVEDLIPGYDFAETLTRAKFEEMNDALFRRTLGPVKRAMEDAMLEAGDVDKVVLVGGSTRIPKVQQLVKDYFDGKEPEKGVDPDESVAVGAAIQAGILSGAGGDAVKDVMLLDVTPLSLGTEADGGLMTVLIKRGTTIPTENTMDFHTVEDGQTHVTVDVYEGERRRAEDNRLLGLFELTDLPPAPRGEVEIRVTFKVDANGLLEVAAQNLATKSTKSVRIAAEDGRLSEEEVARMVEEAEVHAEEDRREVARIEARNALESELYRVRSALDDVEGRIDDDLKEDVAALREEADEAAEWMEREGDGATEEELARRRAEIDAMSGSVFRRLYERGGGGGGADDDEL